MPSGDLLVGAVRALLRDDAARACSAMRWQRVPSRSNWGAMRRTAAAGAFVAALFVAACSGCKSHPPAPADAGAAPVATGLTPEQAAHVLARVGDRTITLGDFETTLEHMDQFDRLRYQSPERRKELLHEMIDVMLLADDARSAHLDQDPITREEIRQILRDALAKTARQGVPTPAEIPVDEVKAYFVAHQADFHDPERRRVSAIVLPTAAAAGAVLATLKGAPPARWGELVRARSIDPQAKANVPVELAGDLGFVSPPGDARGPNPRVPDEVRAAVFQLGAVGDVAAAPVAAAGRFYVIKLAGKNEPHDRTFAEVEPTLRVKLAQDKIHAHEEALVDELRQKFPVKVDEQALSQVRVGAATVDAGADAR